MHSKTFLVLTSIRVPLEIIVLKSRFMELITIYNIHMTFIYYLKIATGKERPATVGYPHQTNPTFSNLVSLV